MNKTLNAITVAGAFMLAGLPLVGVATAARAQERVVIGDLDFGSAKGAGAFEARLDTAARRFCSTGKMSLSEFHACREGVKVEVMEKLTDAQRTNLARAADGKTLRMAAR